MEKTDNNLLGMGEKGWFNWKSWRVAVVGSMGMVCGLAILLMSAWVAINPAGTYSATVMTITPTPTEATAEAKKIEYYLPYPGILPDSPLYKLKAIRDKIKLWLTFDEGDKAKLELTYADKRINAALALGEGNKPDLAVTTATKAEKYLEQATGTAIKLTKLGKDEKSLLLTLEKATAKHGEILTEIKLRAGDEESKTLTQSIMMNKLLSEQVSQALLEAK